MNPETYDQVQVSKDVDRRCGGLSSGEHYGQAIAARVPTRYRSPLPQRVTLEVIETEPVTKGQTASSSYKPAVLSNGVRTTRRRTSPSAPESS